MTTLKTALTELEKQVEEKDSKYNEILKKIYKAAGIEVTDFCGVGGTTSQTESSASLVANEITKTSSADEEETELPQETLVETVSETVSALSEESSDVSAQADTEAATQAATETQTQAPTEAQTQAATEAQTQATTEAQTQTGTDCGTGETQVQETTAETSAELKGVTDSVKILQLWQAAKQLPVKNPKQQQQKRQKQRKRQRSCCRIWQRWKKNVQNFIRS